VDPHSIYFDESRRPQSCQKGKSELKYNGHSRASRPACLEQFKSPKQNSAAEQILQAVRGVTHSKARASHALWNEWIGQCVVDDSPTTPACPEQAEHARNN